MRNQENPPLWRSQARLLQVLHDPLLLAVIGAAILLTLLVAGMTLFWGTGPVLVAIPWYVPMVAIFGSLTNFCVAFLSFGRYHILRDPVSFWVGMGFASLGIGQFINVLAWPGLLPDGRAILAQLSNTPTFITNLNLTIFGSIMLVAVLIRLPVRQSWMIRRWYWVAAASLILVTLAYLFLIAVEQYLPVLVGTDGTFSPLVRGWVVFLLLLFAAGSVHSVRYYWHNKDSLAGCVAFVQTTLFFVILMTILGGQRRYDMWWYAQRVVLVYGCLVVLVGLLNEYVRLLRRERESEARYRLLTEYLPQLVWTSTADGQFDYLSPQWLAYTGVPAAQQMGSGWLHLIHPDDRQRVAAVWESSVMSGEVLDIEFCLRRKDDTYCWFKTLALPIHDSQGQIIQWFGSCTEIEDLKQTEEALQAALAKAEAGSLMLDAIIQNVPVGLAVTGGPPDFRLVKVSQHGLNMNQRPMESLIGIPAGQHQVAWRMLLPDGVTQPLPEHMPLFRASRFGEVINNVELVMEPRDGRHIPVLINAAPVRDANGKIVAAINTWLDISERKQAEAAMAAYARDLERSNRDLQDFAFVASHDLQEPLRKMETFGSMLLEGSPQLSPNQMDLIRRIQESGSRMRSMVDGLLQLSRLEAEAQPFQPVDLNEVIQEVLQDLELQIRRTDGAVEVCDLPVIDADPQQMRRLFQNLIGNGLKFQLPTSKPRIDVCAQPPFVDLVQIEVTDNGIGFDEKHTGHLFEPFKRLVGRNEYEGSGMGLAISRKITERHNGQITVRSQPEQGTTFIITLPIHQERRERSIRTIEDKGGIGV